MRLCRLTTFPCRAAIRKGRAAYKPQADAVADTHFVRLLFARTGEEALALLQ